MKAQLEKQKLEAKLQEERIAAEKKRRDEEARAAKEEMDLELMMAKAQAQKPAPAAAPAGNRDANSGVSMRGSYSYKGGQGKSHSHEWGTFSQICIGGSVDFWSKKNVIERHLFKAHLEAFKNIPAHAKGHFASHVDIF